MSVCRPVSEHFRRTTTTDELAADRALSNAVYMNIKTKLKVTVGPVLITPPPTISRFNRDVDHGGWISHDL